MKFETNTITKPIHTANELYFRVGLVVLNSQTIEKALKVILTFMARDNSQIDFEHPYEWLKKDRMLGQLIKLLKESLDIDESFLEKLEHFLGCRNAIVHHFFEHVDLMTPEGIQMGITLTEECLELCHQISSILRAYSVKNEKRLGIDLSSKIKDDRTLEIEKDHLHLVDTLIKNK